MFDDDYFEGLPNDPILAAQRIAADLLELHRRLPPHEVTDAYEEYVIALHLFEAVSEVCNLGFNCPPLSGNKLDDARRIVDFFNRADSEMVKTAAQLTVGRLKSRFTTKFGRGFFYEFSEGDVSRIQVLINEVRQLITESGLIAGEHKSRLLKRLEGLQRELHKKVSDLDRFWGLIGEAGVMIGKFGNDVKPIVDRIREIAEIVWRTQARTEELPSGIPSPMLKPPSQEE